MPSASPQRIGLILLVLGLAAVATPPMGWGAEATSPLHIVSLVRPRAKVQILDQTTQITVGPEDLKRGYVDVPQAVVLKVWTNSRHGATLLVQSMGQLVGPQGYTLPSGQLSYRMTGAGGLDQGSSGLRGLPVALSQEQGAVRQIAYRLDLTSDTPAGIYQLPVTYLVTPNE
jgi:hypothetical protein